MKILMISLFLLSYMNQLPIKEGDFQNGLLNIVKEKEGLCTPIDNDYVKNYTLMCLLKNSKDLKDIKSQVESLDFIISSFQRVTFKTEILYDTIDKTSLVYSLIVKDISKTKHDKQVILSNESESIRYNLLVCNNFIYRIYLKSIDYFITRLETLICEFGDCKEKDQEAASKINEAFTLFSHLLTEDDKKNIILIFKNIDALDEHEIKLLSYTLSQLRGWVQLDSVKPSSENELNCITSAKNAYDINQNSISFDIWKKDFTSFVSKAANINPISRDDPIVEIIKANMLR